MTDPSEIPEPQYLVPPPGYGQQPAGYGQQPGYYGPVPGTYIGMRAMQPEHPDGTLVLILGVVGIFLCQLIGPVAWYYGSKARKDVQASPIGYSNESLITIGWVLGIVATAILAVFAVITVIYIVILVMAISATGG